MIEALADCLFANGGNLAAGCMAYTLENAKSIFNNKIRFAMTTSTTSGARCSS